MKENLKKSENVRIAEMLKQFANERGVVDVSSGAERYFCVSREKFLKILLELGAEGYHCFTRRVPQNTGSKMMFIRVLCSPDIPSLQDFIKMGKYI